MKLFFKLKINQKLPLSGILLSTLFLVSCASNKTARVQDERVEKVISTARTFVGTPYKYGGTTRSGMDCSGLLLNSFKPINMTLPRTSEAQSKVGKEVKLDELQPVTPDLGEQARDVGGVVDDRREPPQRQRCGELPDRDVRGGWRALQEMRDGAAPQGVDLREEMVDGAVVPHATVKLDGQLTTGGVVSCTTTR
ncbi:MAG TPA: NlpC/P60 family protein [Cyclobacteriaceae bacterium]|nr:NlpC/P60 family protein [Cyclobacteriaceae bacterium]